jgi:ketosteroid isomerase-like protein
MKRTVASLLLSVPLLTLAQRMDSPVIDAEKSFAAFSVRNGTKAAFLQFADSNGLVFERGKAVNALAVWNGREARPGVLNWHPIYGLLAKSGDLGFTSGPWTFQQKTINDSVIARGQYNTVWHKTENGDWKFLLDMGVGNTPDFAKARFNFSEKNVPFTPGTLQDLLKKEEVFVQQTKDPSDRTRAYTASVSTVAFLLDRNGHLPTTAKDDIEKLMSTMPQTITYQLGGSGIARSDDLGYVYGSTTINGKEDSYLRIWRREGKEWKLVLEVLQY